MRQRTTLFSLLLVVYTTSNTTNLVHSFVLRPAPVVGRRSVVIRRGARYPRGVLVRRKSRRSRLFIDPWNDDRSIPIIINGTDVSRQRQVVAVTPPPPAEESSKEGILLRASKESNNNNNAKEENSSSSSWISNPQSAVVLLNLVAILWGTQHAVIKTVVTDESTSAAAFTLCRFALAAVVALPAGLSELLRSSSKLDESHIDKTLASTSHNHHQSTSPDLASLARWGVEMGTWMFLGFAFQAIGLETTTAQKSGFLLYLNVKLVPFFAWIGYGRNIGISTWISAAVVLLGTFLMGGLLVVGNDDATMLTDAQRWNVGDAWSIAAAAASAMFILRLESASRALPQNAGALNAASLLVVTTLAFAWTCFGTPYATSSFPSSATTIDFESLSHLFTSHFGEFFFLGAVTTAGANWIQTAAQRHVSAERASLIYAMDPVYGAAFSYLWLGETLPGAAGSIGAVLIASAAATNAWLEWDKTELQQAKAEQEGSTSHKHVR
eukprot:scaffold34641_cov156-Amphora_coffeaeformis.AAC.3